MGGRGGEELRVIGRRIRKKISEGKKAAVKRREGIIYTKENRTTVTGRCLSNSEKVCFS
jgi:hypothetical protein